MRPQTVARLLLADLPGFVELALVSLVAGLAINASRRQPLPLAYRAREERMHAAVVHLDGGNIRTAPASPTASVPVREVELDEFQPFVSARKGLVIDARPAFVYRDGHVPGAVNLPRDDFETAYRRLGAQLGDRKSETVTVYCSDENCPDSTLVTNALQALGFTRLHIYRQGWEEWSQAGLPQEK